MKGLYFLSAVVFNLRKADIWHLENGKFKVHHSHGESTQIERIPDPPRRDMEDRPQPVDRPWTLLRGQRPLWPMNSGPACSKLLNFQSLQKFNSHIRARIPRDVQFYYQGCVLEIPLWWQTTNVSPKADAKDQSFFTYLVSQKNGMNRNLIFRASYHSFPVTLRKAFIWEINLIISGVHAHAKFHQ